MSSMDTFEMPEPVAATPKAWDGVFPHLYAERQKKPRTIGLTMVIDKNLGTRAVADLLETAADAIDQVKLAFGTSVGIDEGTVRAKVDMLRARGIDTYPGGTLLEAAILYGVWPEFFHRARALGFSMVEVSDGTIHLSAEQRADVIRCALDLGFKVISEVGKKDPRHQPSAGAMQAQIAADLAMGASYVIIEAREGGKGVGIYDATGAVDAIELDDLVKGLEDLERIIWEAPLCPQQAYLINRFGLNVNLGNIPPADVLALEALRAHLRFETMKPVAVEREAAYASDDFFARFLSVAQSRLGQ